MNRLRGRKKEGEGELSASTSTASFFKKNRKPQEEKKQLDISNALPAADDFRTSLLMNNLSARFSMLREQDDPGSLIGKANDDSVLFPRRASRLNLFAHNPLTDIAEVSSVNSSIRPPFAAERQHSFGSEGYGTDDDSASSIMNRARPCDGNVLFGGRQKVYKIPVGSTSQRTIGSPTEDGSGMVTSMSGRALYDSDVALSTFQKLRKEAREQDDPDDHIDGDAADAQESDAAADSGFDDFRKNRATVSSTTSGPSTNRISTAATSIDSQGPNQIPPSDRSSTANSPVVASKVMHSSANAGGFSLERHSTKARRMYGQGLDQTSFNQQNPAASRFDALSRQRTNSVRNLSSSKSAMTLSEKYQNPPTVYTTSPTFRTNSPSPATTSPIASRFDAIDGRTSAAGHHAGSMSPLSPPPDENGTFEAALGPDDRGKATALGLFNRPNKYNDQQFSQRQLQLHEGRNTPPLRKPSLPHKNSRIPSAESYQPVRKPSQTSLHSNVSNELPFRRKISSEESMHQETLTEEEPGPSAGTFFSNSSESESDNEDENSLQLKASSTRQSEMSSPMQSPTIPLFGDQKISTPDWRSEATLNKPDPIIVEEEIPDIPEELNMDDLPIIEEAEPEYVPEVVNSAHLEPASEATTPRLPEVDSPTLGPAEGLGLSGLVRTHLRQDSDTSRYSMLPPPSPKSMAGVARGNARGYNEPISIHSNPWEFDDVDPVQEDYDNNATPASPPPALAPVQTSPAANAMSDRARQMLNLAKALRAQNEAQSPEQSATRSRSPSGGSQPSRPSDESVPSRPWQDEMQARHTRVGSTETQQEMDEFANELAERRRRVEEKMKSVVGNESRSASPAFGGRVPDSKAGAAFGMLKVKTSMSTMGSRQDKAAKMLGFNSSSPMSTPARSPSTEPWRHDEDHPSNRGMKSRPLNVTGFQQPWQKGRQAGSPRIEVEEPVDPMSPPRSARPTMRSRSSSQTSSGRSKSRNGRMRDEMKSPEPEFNGAAIGTINEHQAPRGIPPRRSDESVNQISPGGPVMAPGRPVWTNNRSASNPYFDPSALPVQSHLPAPLTSPRPSPFAAFSANSTPPLERTPDPSAAPLPASHVVPPPGYGTRHPSMAPRKKSVIKSQISEPKFVSGTSNVTTISLPVGASLRNGMESPPVPPQNPKRRLTLFGRAEKEKTKETDTRINDFPPMPGSASTIAFAYSDERSNFSDEGVDKRSMSSRQRLRKTSSEGGSLNAKARAQAMAMPSPAIPAYAHSRMTNAPTPSAEGGMF